MPATFLDDEPVKSDSSGVTFLDDPAPSAVAPPQSPSLLDAIFGRGTNHPAPIPRTAGDDPYDYKAPRPSYGMPIAKTIDDLATMVTGQPNTELESLLGAGTREQDARDKIIPTIPQQQGKLAQIGAAAANVPLEFANFTLSPEGQAIIPGLGMAPKAIRTLTGLLFAGQETKAAIQSETLQEGLQHALGAAAIGLGTGVDALERPNASVKPESAKPNLEPSQVPVESVLQPEAKLPNEPVVPSPDRAVTIQSPNEVSTTAETPTPLEPIAPQAASTPNEPVTTEAAPDVAPPKPILSTAIRQGDQVLTSDNPVEPHNGVATRNGLEADSVPAEDKGFALPNEDGSKTFVNRRQAFPMAEQADLLNEQGKAERIAADKEGRDPELKSEYLKAPETPISSSGESQPVASGLEPKAETSSVASESTPKAEPSGTTGISQASHEQRGSGVKPGEGSSPEEITRIGQEDLKAGADPEAVAVKVDNREAISPRETGLLRAKVEELSKETNRAQDAADANPNDPALKRAAEDAFKAENDFRQRIKPAATLASDVFKGYQGQTDIDTGSFTGIRRAFAEQTGRDMTLKEQATAREQAAKIKELQDKIDAHESAASNQKQLDAYKAIVRESIDSARQGAKQGKGLQTVLDEAAAKARQRIIDRRGTLQVTIDPLNVAGLVDEAIIGASHISRGVTKFADWSVEMVKDFGDRIKPFLQDLYSRAQQYHDAHAKFFTKSERPGLTDEQRLARFKTSLQKQIATGQGKLDTGDLSKPVRVATKLDKEAQALKVERDRINQKIAEKIEKVRQENRTGFEKFQDAAVKWSRTAKLSSVAVFPKLAEAGLIRIVTNPITRVLAQPLRLIPGFAEKAISEVGVSAKAEAANIAGIFTSGKEAWRKLVTGKSNIDVMGGKIRDNEMMNFVGNVHGAIKEPVRQGEFARSTQLRLEQADKQGLDVHEPATQATVASAGVADANRQIFMGENPLTKYLIKLPVSALRKADFVGAKTLANTIDFLMPIVNVSTNIAIHTARLHPAIGFSEALTRLGVEAKRGNLSGGASGLSEANAGAIARSFGAGALGTLLAAYAWQHPEKFGGAHDAPIADKNKKLKAGSIEIFGHVIPSWMNHAPEMNFLNVVASSRRIYDRYYKKDPGHPTNAATEALAFSMMSPVKNLPFIDTYLRLFSDRTSAGQKVGALARDAIIPGAVTSTLRLTDKKERKPKSALQEFKMGIPGKYGRESVPAK